MGKPDDRERRAEKTDDVSRRRFLQTMGVGAATAATMREPNHRPGPRLPYVSTDPSSR